MTPAVYPPVPAGGLDGGSATNGQIPVWNSALGAWVPESLASGGTKWWTGAGAPGTVAGAATGDYYLRTSNGEVYRSTAGESTWADQGFSLQGAAASNGTNGTNGTNGAAGTNGATWFTGAGAPGTVTGAVTGDRYVNTTNGEVYKSTSGASTWADQGFSIKGAIGPEGPPGGGAASFPQNSRPESIEPFYLDTTTTANTPVTGRQYFAYCTALRTFSLKRLGMVTGGAQSGATLIRFGLCSVNAEDEPTVVAKTANIATGTPENLANKTAQNALSVASTEFVYPTEAAFEVVAGTRYALTVLIVNTVTMPTLYGLNAPLNVLNSRLYGSTRRKAANNSGTLTDLPETIVKVAALANTTINFYMAGMA